MTGVIKYPAARMVTCGFQKAFKGDTVMKVFAGMNLKTAIDALFFVVVKNGAPP